MLSKCVLLLVFLFVFLLLLLHCRMDQGPVYPGRHAEEHMAMAHVQWDKYQHAHVFYSQKKKNIYICKRKITFQNLPNTCRGALWLPIWLPISYRRATAIWRPREQESAPCLFKFFILPFCSSNCMLFQLTIPQKIAVRRLWQISLGPCWALRTNFSSIFSMVRPWDTGVNKRRMKTV